MPIERTVIGSFPKSAGPLEDAIRQVVDLQLSYGIDLITDGEQRGNMIQYFDQVPGLQRVGSGVRIVGKVKPIGQDKIDEFYKIVDFRFIQSVLKSLGKDMVKAKITLTGPMTLGTTCASTDIDSASKFYGLDDEEALYSDFSRVLLPIVERALDVGAYVQIDEPLLSTGQVSLEVASKILKDFTSRLPSLSVKEEKVSCHVCGSIRSVPGLYDVLLGLGIPILSLGFSGEEEKDNLEIISRESLEEHGKKLGVGFISNITVEDDSVVIERYRRIEKTVGKENIRYLHPDCGFGLTRRDRVNLILEKMKKISDTIV